MNTDTLKSKNTFGTYMLLAVLIAVGSEIHFYPLNSLLRISMGIIILNIAGMVREDIDPLPMILLAGMVIFGERLITGVAFREVPYEVAFLNGLPSLVYYIVFAFLFKASHIYRHRDEFFRTLLLLAVVDIVSNGLEALMRNDFSSKTLMIIILVGFIRSFVAYAVYTAWRRKELFIIRQEHQKRYSQLNMLVANVESELFYLKKSSGDIESVMSKCYALYGEAAEDGEDKKALLDISKDIHDIKKDYLRVLNGFQDFVDNLQELEFLKVSDIFEIMKTNYNKVKRDLPYTIHLSYEQKGNPVMENYLSVFTILNNLIDNSISACKEGCLIRVIYAEHEHSHQFIVMDNGEGISESLVPLIFNPGFTTKYDAVTGQANTGIGLTHVKNTIDSLKGQITVESIEGAGTKFVITMPKGDDRKKAAYE